MANEEEKPESQAAARAEPAARHASRGWLARKALPAERCGRVSWLLPVPAPCPVSPWQGRPSRRGVGLLGGCSASRAHRAPGEGAAFAGQPCGSAAARGGSCAAGGTVWRAVGRGGSLAKRRPARGLRAARAGNERLHVSARGVISASPPELIALPSGGRDPGEWPGLSRALRLLPAPNGCFSPQKAAGSPASCNGSCQVFDGQHKTCADRKPWGDDELRWVRVPAPGHGRAGGFGRLNAALPEGLHLPRKTNLQT